MIVAISQETDLVAQRVLAELNGPARTVEVMDVSIEELAAGTTWAYRSRGAGATSVVRLGDGRCLDSHRLTAVLNRLRYAPSPWFSGERDREYAAMEMFALILPWLDALPCPVINPASARGLCGTERSLAEWLRCGTEAGLAARRIRVTTDGRRFPVAGRPWQAAPTTREWIVAETANLTVPPGPRPTLFAEPVEESRRILVVGSRVFGAPDVDWESHARSLSRRAGAPFLELTLGRSVERGIWVLCNATHFPDRVSGEEAAALAALLQNQGEAP